MICNANDLLRDQKEWVAVGTAIADRPPHRSVRALLTHTAPTSDIWRQSGRSGKDAQVGAGEASVGSIHRAGPG